MCKYASRLFQRGVNAAIVAGLMAIAATVRAEPVGPIGAWFGIARPCATSATVDPNAAMLCRAVCGVCSSVPGAPGGDIVIMPTLLADGTALADGGGALGGFTTAHGQWTPSKSDGLPDVPGRTRYQATFIWLQPSHSVRPRFVTFFARNDPDVMFGFLQPYVFEGVPSLEALPACTPENQCLGTYYFVIRRIKVQ
jgi:hypothetical protein